MFQKRLLVTFFFIAISFSLTIGFAQTESEPAPVNRDKEVIPDIQARILNFDHFTPPLNTKMDNSYVNTYNKAVQFYNNNAYGNAIPLLEKLSNLYDDNGKVLFLLGNSYLYNEEYDKALRYFHFAQEASYGKEKTDQKIQETLSEAGSSFLKKSDYSNAIACYKTALQYQDDPTVKHNIIYSYTELARRLKRPHNAIMLLYAYHFYQKNPVEGDILTVVANNLCNYIVKPPQYELFYQESIRCISDAMDLQDDPYLHQSLGYIYLYRHQDSLAKAEFKKVIDNYRNSPYYEACFELYNNIGTASYHFQAVYPIVVEGSRKIKTEIMVQIPQSYEFQTTGNFQVTFNNQKTGYQIVSDIYNTKYCSLNISEGFRLGRNELTIDCDVEVESKRISAESLGDVNLTDYRKDKWYEKLTTKNEVFDIQDPRVQKMAGEIRQKTGSAKVINLVASVYNYVNDFMEYKMVATKEKVSLKRALANAKTGVCEDYAVLTVTLLRALGIPATYFSGETFQKPFGHAWAVWFTPEKYPVPLDTTWGDTSGNPDLYFLASSNLNITRSFGLDSEVMPGGTGISLRSSATESYSAKLGTPEIKMKKVNPGN